MDSAAPPVLLTNALLVDPETGRETAGDLFAADGLIRDLGASVRGSRPEGARVIDCRGRVVAPGLVDMRAFVGEPGGEHRDSLASASRAAAAGGVTTVVCMPETTPPVDDPAVVDFLIRRARDTAIVRMLPSAAITKGLEGREMAEIGLLSDAGAVFLTDGSRSLRSAQVLRRALTYARDIGALIVHHCEEPDLVGEGVMNEGELATRLGLLGIPREAETVMLERDMRIVRLTGGRYHAAMVSCADSIAILRRAREEGLRVTAGASINSLTLNENDIGPYRTFLKLSPPLRHEDDRLALVEAVAQGLVDVIVSDHNPQDVETKRQPFAEAANGAIGIETMLAAGLRLVHAGEVALPVLLRAMSTRPAEIMGLPQGRLARGAPADLVVFDPDEPFVLDPATLHSRSKNTPFDAARLQGVVHATLVAGRVVYERG